MLFLRSTNLAMRFGDVHCLDEREDMVCCKYKYYKTGVICLPMPGYITDFVAGICRDWLPVIWDEVCASRGTWS